MLSDMLAIFEVDDDRKNELMKKLPDFVKNMI